MKPWLITVSKHGSHKWAIQVWANTAAEAVESLPENLTVHGRVISI